MAQTIGSIDLASLKNLRDDVTQYFWFESNSSSAWGSGAHVTLYPESQFTNPNHANYLKGQNIIMNTDGFSIRNGALPMMVLDNDSLDFNAVDTTQGTYTTMATFGLTGAQIGQTNGAHIQINSSGLNINTNSSTNIANFGVNGARIGQTSGAHVQISSSGLDVNLNSSTNIANFGTNGARIGKVGGAHSIIDADGQRFYASDGSVQLANIGYGEGTSSSGSSSSPYFTFGTRDTPTRVYDSTQQYWVGNMVLYGNPQKAYVCKTRIETPEEWNEAHWALLIGNWSTVIGRSCIACGPDSYAEGSSTTAINFASHAEGYGTKATGSYSHAEGFRSIAWEVAHAEGNETEASAQYSHSQNLGTKAVARSQTTIGEYNIVDTEGSRYVRGDYAFIIGNGTSDNARSNAFTVDWDGNIEASGTISAQNSTPSMSISTSTGTHISHTVQRYGNVVQLLMTVQNSSSVAQGGNIYEGTITTTGLRPIMTTTAGSYYSTSAITGTISTAGGIVIRNEGGAKTFTSNCNISFTYIVAP